MPNVSPAFALIAKAVHETTMYSIVKVIGAHISALAIDKPSGYPAWGMACSAEMMDRKTMQKRLLDLLTKEGPSSLRDRYVPEDANTGPRYYVVNWAELTVVRVPDDKEERKAAADDIYREQALGKLTPEERAALSV